MKDEDIDESLLDDPTDTPAGAAKSARRHQRRKRVSPEDLERTRAIHRRLVAHPLGTMNGLLETKPVTELFNKIKDELLLAESGLYIGASSGDGKSAAIKIIVQMIRDYFGPRAIGVHDFLNHSRPAPAGFHVNMLESLGIPDAKGTAVRLSLRLTHTIVQQAKELGDRSFILFLDEAQVVSNQEFQYLKDLENVVARHGVKLIPILFGENPMLQTKIQELKRDENHGASARFGAKGLKFRSYSSEGDIWDILDQMDSQQDADGIYWTEFFFPNAFNGPEKFRLADQAENFYRALLRLHEKGDTYGFSARPVFATIRSFVLKYMSGKERPQIPDNAWDKLVDSERMKDSLMHKQSHPTAQTGKALRSKRKPSGARTD